MCAPASPFAGACWPYALAGAVGEALPVQRGSNSLNSEFTRHVQKEEERCRGLDGPCRRALAGGRRARRRPLPRPSTSGRPASGRDSTAWPSRKPVSTRRTTFSTPDDRAVVPVGRNRGHDVRVAQQGRAQAQRARHGAHARRTAGTRSARGRSTRAPGARPATRYRCGLSCRNPAPRCGRRPPPTHLTHSATQETARRALRCTAVVHHL